MSLFKKNPLYIIYVAVFFFSAHSALTSYINSSFLTDGRGVSGAHIGIIYTIGSIITLIVLAILSRILRVVSIKKILLGTILALILLLSGILIVDGAVITALLFVIYLATSSGIFFLNDIFVEHHTQNESTGKIRGIFFTVINIAWAVSPLLAGVIAQQQNGYTYLYALALILMVVVLGITLSGYVSFPYAVREQRSFLSTLKVFFSNIAITRIFLLSVVLNLFYAVMIIYSPLYLHTVIGLSWTHIGIAFTCMLLAFVFFQAPLGRLADTRLGEKEILSLGLVVMAVMTYVFATMSTPHWYLWALVLFGTRTGAAAVEIMCETYFFKQITDSEPTSISVFRNAQPLAYIVAPLIVSALLSFEIVSYQGVFIILALIVASGLLISLKLVDTK